MRNTLSPRRFLSSFSQTLPPSHQHQRRKTGGSSKWNKDWLSILGSTLLLSDLLFSFLRLPVSFALFLSAGRGSFYNSSLQHMFASPTYFCFPDSDVQQWTSKSHTSQEQYKREFQNHWVWVIGLNTSKLIQTNNSPPAGFLETEILSLGSKKYFQLKSYLKRTIRHPKSRTPVSLSDLHTS